MTGSLNELTDKLISMRKFPYFSASFLHFLLGRKFFKHNHQIVMFNFKLLHLNPFHKLAYNNELQNFISYIELFLTILLSDNLCHETSIPSHQALHQRLAFGRPRFQIRVFVL